MKRARFTEEQIIGVLREHEAAAKTADLAHKHGVSEGTLYNWKAKYGGMVGYLTPATYAASLNAMCDRLRNPDQLRRSHVALPAPDGVKPAETLIATGCKFSGRSPSNKKSQRW